jgi:glutamate-5-semialdehyde dehydrogenase
MAILNIAMQAKETALKLANISTETKDNALLLIADELDNRRTDIMDQNVKDIELAKKENLPTSLIKRLTMDEPKIDEVIQSIKSVTKLEDPVGKTLLCTELDEGLDLYKVVCPIGVIGVIFESRPDALLQISSLCLKSGNAVILKGGSESANTNRILTELIRNALAKKGIPENSIQLIETREDVKEVLKLYDYIDLLIPRGSNSLVRYIQENTKIPVLGHADGICHGYVDLEADLDIAVNVCYDAKVQYPAVCNAMETLLVHKDIAAKFLPVIAKRYEAAKVELRGDAATKKFLPDIKDATADDWVTEYNDLILSIKIVDSLQEAIDHINQYGSGHTDMIITSNEDAAKHFLNSVDSAVVLRNASTRFSDGYRFGFGAEVGISTNKIHARGPVGLEGLTIYKYIVIGKGQTVSTYTGEHPKPFTHKSLSKLWKGS